MKFQKKWILSSLILILTLTSLKSNAFLIEDALPAQSIQLSDLNLFFKTTDLVALQDYKNRLDVKVTAAINNFNNTINAKKTEDCEKKLNIGFHRITADGMSDINNFENEIVIGSGSICLKANSAIAILNTLFSEKFLRATIKGVSGVQVDNQKNIICQQNNVFPFGDSNFCFKISVAGDDNQIIVRASHLKNNQPASYVVYFQEGLVSIKKIKENGFRVSTYNVGRGPTIPFHGLALNVLQSEQEKYFEKLTSLFGSL